jgi:hypothetical protein
MKKILTALICLSFSLPVMAHTDYKNEVSPAGNQNNGWWSPARLSVGAYGGYGVANGAYKQDGQYAQTRLSLGLRAAEYNVLTLGVEAGVQSGNSMRLAASDVLIATAGGMPIQSTLKPLVDLLLTVKGQLLPNNPLFGILKGGVAYRQLVLENRTSARDGLRQLDGEFQAGLAYSMTSHATITAFYQGIYSGANAGLAINTAGDVTISRIPTQQAGFLGFEYSL